MGDGRSNEVTVRILGQVGVGFEWEFHRWPGPEGAEAPGKPLETLTHGAPPDPGAPLNISWQE